MRSFTFGLMAVLLLAAPAFATDGDLVKPGDGVHFTGPKPVEIKLCDTTITNRTCTEFDLWTVIGQPVAHMTFSIVSDASDCDAASQAAVNVRHATGGRSHTIGTLTQTAESIYTDADGYRYVSIVTSGLTGACTDLTVHGVFTAAR